MYGRATRLSVTLQPLTPPDILLPYVNTGRMRPEFFRRARQIESRRHRRSHENGWRLSARPRDGFRSQSLRDYACWRRDAIQEAAIRGVGKACGDIGSDAPHRSASSSRRSGCCSVHSDRRRHIGRLRCDGPPRGCRNLEAISGSRLSLRGGSDFSRAPESRIHPARTVRGRKRGNCDRSRTQTRFRRGEIASHGGRSCRGRTQSADRLQHLPQYRRRWNCETSGQEQCDFPAADCVL